jgi:hypothetical protein
MAEIACKDAAERMCRYHYRACVIDDLPEFFGTPNAGDVFVQPIDENVPQVGAHFHPAQKEEIVLNGELSCCKAIPTTVVLCHDHAVQPETLRF